MSFYQMKYVHYMYTVGYRNLNGSDNNVLFLGIVKTTLVELIMIRNDVCFSLLAFLACYCCETSS